MTSAIIVAAGSSLRMGFDKMLAPLAGRPVLLRTLEAFQACPAIDDMIVVANGVVASAVTAWKEDHSLAKISQVVEGGAERHLSVWNGLQCMRGRFDLVAVHDGGRPLITHAQIARCVVRAGEVRASASARRVTETLKRADEAGRIIESIERTGAWVMETPQVFDCAMLVEAYEGVIASRLHITDEVSAVQRLGREVYLVENETPNPKITFPSDLALAEKLLA